jgi:hypothetical protein
MTLVEFMTDFFFPVWLMFMATVVGVAIISAIIAIILGK